MKNKIIFISLCLLIVAGMNSSFAMDDEFGFEKAMLMRKDIQTRLNLTENQKQKRLEINEKYNPLFDKKFAEIGEKINELRILAASSDCTKERVDSIVRDFDIAEDELFEINKRYEKEFKSVLSPSQKIKYSFLKQNSREQLKRELKKQMKELRK